jgi:peptidoglycan LD-endopeptidase LytH
LSLQVFACIFTLMDLIHALHNHKGSFAKVTPFEFTKIPLMIFDFTEENSELRKINLGDEADFCGYINQKLAKAGTPAGIGRYNEDRTIYRKSPLFGESSEFRSVHLGIDIWAEEGTPVMAPLAGEVHSFQNNSHTGDYGPTLILRHVWQGFTFHTLYGHLSRTSLDGLQKGIPIAQGQQIGALGAYEENVHWPPHLHFQIIRDMQGKWGDYPGVCTVQDSAFYLQNCPDPNLLLGIPGL